MANEYKINTVQDMINATNSDNIESFLSDLRELLTTAHAMNNIAKAKGGKLESDGFLWIDDDKKEISITIQPQMTCKCTWPSCRYASNCRNNMQAP